MIRILLFFVALLSNFSITSYAFYAGYSHKFQHPCYFGLISGYGTTTWGGLVAKDQNDAMMLSTPVSVKEGGYLKGLYAGYEFSPIFAVEASYLHYPTARVYFDYNSLFAFFKNMTELTTNTDRLAIMGKFMVFVPYTEMRLFSSVGAAEVHRHDSIYNIYKLRPIFNIGLNYNITDHLMAEIGGEYVAGDSRSELDPALHYIPFIYSGFVRIALRV